MIQEIERKPVHGGVAFAAITLTALATGYWFYEAATDEAIVSAIAAVLLLTGELGCYHGLMFVYPNAARVLVLFGAYKGTAREPGWRWVNPFYQKLKLSVRVRNFETSRMKVNDRDGNPIEIAAVVVWKVTDTAEASFEVDDFVNYVHVQSESAVRNLAVHYAYDTHDDEALSLRGSTDHVAENLREQIEAPRTCASRSRRGSSAPGSPSSRRASAISPTRPRSPRRCCVGNRRGRSSPRGRRSSRVRWAWSKWHSSCSRSSRSSSWTRSARRRWSPIFSSCSAASTTRNPSSIRARSTPERARRGQE
jgi:hypothetical protein